MILKGEHVLNFFPKYFVLFGRGHVEKSMISLRLIDWFATNYCKKHYIVYNFTEGGVQKRFKVYQDYKLKLKAYSKKRFDPFCRWDRITIPYKDDTFIEAEKINNLLSLEKVKKDLN